MTSPTLYHPRPERWPQVSLKGFFVLVTLAGVLCWLGIQVKWIRDRHEAVRERLGWVTGGPAPATLRILGETGALRIRVMNGSPAEIERMRVLFPEAESVEFLHEGRDLEIFR